MIIKSVKVCQANKDEIQLSLMHRFGIDSISSGDKLIVVNWGDALVPDTNMYAFNFENIKCPWVYSPDGVNNIVDDFIQQLGWRIEYNMNTNMWEISSTIYEV